MDRFKTPQFKALEREWYAKLKESGFVDAEDSEGMLKSWHSCYFQQRFEPDYYHHKEEYYRQAGIFLETYRFTSQTDKEIWALHSKGLSLREISKEFEGRKNSSKDSINSVIKRLASFMESGKQETKPNPHEQLELGFNPRRRRKR